MTGRIRPVVKKERHSDPATHRATREDLAAALSLTLSTVSRALNNHPLVALRTRQRVEKAAREMGYVPNHAALRMVRARFKTARRSLERAGFLLLDPKGHPLGIWCLMLMRGAEDALSAMGAGLSFIRIGDDEGWNKLSTMVRCGSLDGLLVTGEVDDAATRRIAALNIPYVVLGSHRCATPRFPSVAINFLEAGRMGARHLASLGHRHVAFLGTSLSLPYQRDLLDGFCRALREAKRAAAPSLIRIMERRKERLDALLDGLFALKRGPDAVFVAEYGMVATVVEALRDRGMDVPGQISVLGCELDLEPSLFTHLAYVNTSHVEVGAEGVRILARQLERPSHGANSTTLIPPLLVPGRSCRREPRGD